MVGGWKTHAVRMRRAPREPQEKGNPMALKDLLTTDYGLLSLAVIVGVIVIGVYLTRMLNRLMNEPGEKR